MLSAPRIASLSPALSATVARLGLADHLVGRTPWCAGPGQGVDPAVTVVGDLREFDGERLVRLRPTHLLVQPPRSGIDPGLARLARSEGWTVFARPIDGVDDIRSLIADLPTVLAGNDVELLAALTDRARALQADIDMALAPDLDVAEPGNGPPAALASPVLLLFGVDPPMAFGPGSYLGDILERLGGRNAIDVPGYPQISLEDVVRAAPRSIVLVRAAPGRQASEGDLDLAAATNGVEATKETSKAASVLPASWNRLGLEAQRQGRVALLEDPAALLPGPDVARLAEGLRRVLVKCAEEPSPKRDPAIRMKVGAP